jgi:hypothetical protein
MDEMARMASPPVKAPSKDRLTQQCAAGIEKVQGLPKDCGIAV